MNKSFITFKPYESFYPLPATVFQCVPVFSKKLINIFEIEGQIIGIGMNSNYLIIIGDLFTPKIIHLINYKTGEKTLFETYLYPSQLNMKFDVSERYLVLTCFRGLYEAEWMEMYDLKTKGIFKQKLGDKGETGLEISIYNDEIIVSTTKNKLKVFEIDRTSKKEALLAIYQKKFGNIGENYDIRRYILEFLNLTFKKKGKTLKKNNNFLLHENTYEIPRIEIYYTYLD